MIKSDRPRGFPGGGELRGRTPPCQFARSCRVAHLGTLQINSRYSVREARYRTARQILLVWVCGGSRGLECDSRGGEKKRSRSPGRAAGTRERFARRSSNGFQTQNSASSSVTLSGCHVRDGQWHSTKFQCEEHDVLRKWLECPTSVVPSYIDNDVRWSSPSDGIWICMQRHRCCWTHFQPLV